MEAEIARLAFDHEQEAGNIPLQMLGPYEGRRGRPSRAPARDPIINRRQRPRNLSTSTLSSLMPSSPPSFLSPQRPVSARTTTSRIGRRAIPSPLSQQMPPEVCLGCSLRFYGRERDALRAQEEMIRSTSSPMLRRSEGH
jgi:hypothetical protein